MALRLLQKREVDRAKTLDRKREIDEGAKLAQKVDDLRRLYSTEEKTLRDFRDKSLKVVLEDISRLSADKEALQSEVKALEHRKVRALIPVKIELEKLPQAKAQLAEVRSLLELEESIVVAEKRNMSARKADIKAEKERAADERAQSKQALREADDARTEAKKTLREAQQTSDSMLQRANQLAAEMMERETNLAYKEEGLNAQFKQLEKEKLGIINRERVLQDRYNTLQRTLNRLNIKQ